MNCFCNIFDNEVLWLIIIALIILFAVCDNGGGGYCLGNTPTYNNHGCC